MGVGTDHTFKDNMSSEEHKSYTREYKLEVIRHFHKVERNAYATAKKFNISWAVKDWVKKETTIQVFFWLLCKVMTLKLTCCTLFLSDIEEIITENWLWYGVLLSGNKMG